MGILNITYRNANSSDILKLSVLFKQVYIATYGINGVSDEFANFITDRFSVERLEKLVTNTPENIIVADYQNNLIGVAEVELDKECPVQKIVAPELSKLYILEWFCGKGVGQNLIQEAENLVIQKGLNQMWLWVLETNLRAINFYSKQGYKEIGKASFQMEVNKYENIVMLKTLK